MSNSKKRSDKFNLEVRFSNEDMRAKLFDGYDNLIRVDELDYDINLNKGIYYLRTEVSGSVDEELIRLDKDIVIEAKEPERNSVIPIPNRKNSKNIDYNRLLNLSYRPSDIWLFASDEHPNSSLFFLLRFENEFDSSHTEKMQILDKTRNKGDLRFNRFLVESNYKEKWYAFSIALPHGYYELKIDDRIMPLHIVEGWQTQIFLTHDEIFDFEDMRIFMGKTENGLILNEKTMDALDKGLDYLTMIDGELPKSMLNIFLKGKFSNPVLGILAAHLLLKQLKPNWKILKEVIDNLQRILPDFPDVLIIKLLFAKRHSQFLKLEPIKNPPMFSVSLKALVNIDQYSPQYIDDDSDIENIIPETYEDSPWTSWGYIDPNLYRREDTYSRPAQKRNTPDMFTTNFTTSINCNYAKIESDNSYRFSKEQDRSSWIQESLLAELEYFSKNDSEINPVLLAQRLGITIKMLNKSLIELLNNNLRSDEQDNNVEYLIREAMDTVELYYKNGPNSKKTYFLSKNRK